MVAARQPTPAQLREISRTAAARELRARRVARTTLLDFTRYTFSGYQVNWHHALLCEYLDRFVSGEITRLIVSMPPRHGKSELVSRRLPAYILGRQPTASIIATSYAAGLASEMNRAAQRIIDSPEYRRLFPDTQLSGKNVRTTSDTSWLRNADVFEVVGYGGAYRSAGVGGGITGKGFDYGIIDDPVKDRQEANSATIRQRVWDWYTSTFYTRQAPNAGILLTMTRWHKDDLAGRLIDTMQDGNGDNWTVLTLPAVAEGELHPDDPREQGESLWPAQYDRDFLDKVKANNAVDWAALYQQQPIALGNELFDVANIRVLDTPPDCTRTVRFYDLAVTSKQTSDYTVGLKLGVTHDERLVILDMYRVQKELPHVQEGIVQNAGMDGKETPIVLEGEKAGIIQLDYLLRDSRMRPYSISTETPVGDKYTRAAPVATRVNNGRVDMVRGSWNRALLTELSTFPQGQHDDIVDALSGAWAALDTPRQFLIMDDY